MMRSNPPDASIDNFLAGHRMRSWLLCALWLGASGQSAAQADHPEPAAKLVLDRTVTVNSQPEAATGDGDGLFVSSLGSDNSGGANDGSVQRFFWDGSLDPSFQLATSLNNPMGIVTIADQIVVVDVDRVLLITRSGELASEISMAQTGTRALNDVTKVDDRHAIVSATDLKKLFLIDLPTAKVTELQVDFDLNNPNGLHFDSESGSLYLTDNLQNEIGEEGNGTVIRAAIDLTSGSGRRVWASSIGKFVDGIDLQGKAISVSDWVQFGTDGARYELDSETGEVIARETVGAPGFADLVWNEDGTRVVLVGLDGNQIRFYLPSSTPN